MEEEIEEEADEDEERWCKGWCRAGGKQTVIDGDTDGHTGRRRCVFVLAGLCQREGVTHQHLYQNDRQLKGLM